MPTAIVNSLAARLALALLLAMAASWLTYQVTVSIKDAQIQRLVSGYASAVSAAHRQAYEKFQAEQLRANELAVRLDAARAQLDELESTLKHEALHVTRSRQSPAPDGALDPSSSAFTVGFVSVWNRATGAQRSADLYGSDVASGVDTAPAAARDAGTGLRDPFGVSAVTEADVLTNHVDNALRCRAIEAQLNAVLDYYEGGRQ